MKALRASTISRSLVVAVMLFSWLVVTNHCALGMLQSALGASAEHAHCHAAKTDSGKKAPADGMRECCRAIKASLASETVVKFAPAQIQFQSYAILAALLTPVASPAPDVFRDHGPPRASSFAEIVWQRSLLSHAPPILA
ncbi:MAG: hypothetical protein P4L99_14695 [Chthoniobacter sp.]|nr:hypothetical protein [Chthoniobacter sp.]